MKQAILSVRMANTKGACAVDYYWFIFINGLQTHTPLMGQHIAHLHCDARLKAAKDRRRVWRSNTSRMKTTSKKLSNGERRREMGSTINIPKIDYVVLIVLTFIIIEFQQICSIFTLRQGKQERKERRQSERMSNEILKPSGNLAFPSILQSYFGHMLFVCLSFLTFFGP